MSKTEVILSLRAENTKLKQQLVELRQALKDLSAERKKADREEAAAARRRENEAEREAKRADKIANIKIDAAARVDKRMEAYADRQIKRAEKLADYEAKLAIKRADKAISEAERIERADKRRDERMRRRQGAKTVVDMPVGGMGGYMAGFTERAKHLNQNQLLSNVEAVMSIFTQMGGKISQLSIMLTTALRPMAIMVEMAGGFSAFMANVLPLAGYFAAAVAPAAAVAVSLWAWNKAMNKFVQVANDGLDALKRMKEGDYLSLVDGGVVSKLTEYEKLLARIEFRYDRIAATWGAKAANIAAGWQDFKVFSAEIVAGMGMLAVKYAPVIKDMFMSMPGPLSKALGLLLLMLEVLDAMGQQAISKAALDKAKSDYQKMLYGDAALIGGSRFAVDANGQPLYPGSTWKTNPSERPGLEPNLDPREPSGAVDNPMVGNAWVDAWIRPVTEAFDDMKEDWQLNLPDLLKYARDPMSAPGPLQGMMQDMGKALLDMTDAAKEATRLALELNDTGFTGADWSRASDATAELNSAFQDLSSSSERAAEALLRLQNAEQLAMAFNTVISALGSMTETVNTTVESGIRFTGARRTEEGGVVAVGFQGDRTTRSTSETTYSGGGAAFEAINSVLGLVLPGVGSLIGTLIDLILTNKLPELGSAFVGAVVKLIVEIPQQMGDLLVNILPELVDAFFTLILAPFTAGRMMAQMYRVIPTLMGEVVKVVIGGIPMFLTAIANTLLRDGDSLYDAFKGIPKLLVEAFMEGLSEWKNVFGKDGWLTDMFNNGGFLGTGLFAKKSRKAESFDTGGVVTRTGLAMVHKGERYLGVGRHAKEVGRSVSIGSINIMTQDTSQLVPRLRRELGSYGRGYTLEQILTGTVS